MDIKEFDSFLTLCKYKNISRAASELFISQQGLSKMIQRWEREFGVPLFTRSHSGLDLTRFGHILEKHSQAIVSEYNAVINCIKNETQLQTNLMVTIDLGGYSILTPDIFISFQETYPDIELTVQEHTEKTNRRLLDEEEADLCIALAPAQEEYDFTPFYDVEGVVLISKDNPLSKKEYISAEDLKDERLIILGSACNYAYVRACRRAGFEPNLVISSVEMDDPHPYIRTNYGICASFRGLVREPESDENSVLLPFRSKNLWSIGYLCKKNIHLSVQARLFIDHMVSFASNTKLLFC